MRAPAPTRSPQPAGGDEVAVHGRQYLAFVLGGESFGIVTSSVKEIIEYRAPTEVPLMPDHMRGVINLRGRVLPVVDLAARFGRSSVAATRRTCIVILEVQEDGERHDIGVVVDAVSAVVEIADADVQPPPSFGASLRPDFISGMGRLGERFLILLDVGKVLSLEELAMQQPPHAEQDVSAGLQSPRPAAPEAPDAPGC